MLQKSNAVSNIMGSVTRQQHLLLCKH